MPDQLLADHLAEQWGATSWKTALHICGAEDELGALGGVLQEASGVSVRLHSERLARGAAPDEGQFGIVVRFFWRGHESVFLAPEILIDPVGLGAI